MNIVDFITPKGSWILVEYLENDKTASGIVIPESSREQEWELQVMAVGEDVTQYKPGDYVVLEMGARIASFERLGKKWAMVRDQFICMVVDPKYREVEKQMKAEKKENTKAPIIVSSNNLKVIN